MLVKKHDFIIIICTLFCGLGVLFINDPTVCLAIALIQTIMIFKKAKISLFSILAFLLNFCLIQEYGALPKLAYPLSLIVLTVIITVSYETIPEYVLMIENLIACFLFWNCLDYFKHLKVYGWMEIYFFIYSFHETPQLIINKLFSVTVPLTGYAAALINTITGAVLTILVAELLAKILMTFSPKIWMILNGRRKFINSK